MKKKLKFLDVIYAMYYVIMFTLLILGSIMSCGVSMFMLYKNMYIGYSILTFMVSFIATIMFSWAYVDYLKKWQKIILSMIITL
jgi:hypothetical protein